MSDIKNLIKVKLALAEKYERLARIAKSAAKTQQFAYRALRYRRQVDQLQHASQS